MNGKKLEELRIEKGFTRREIAEILYENESHIQSWEQEWYVNAPTASDIEDMAEAFDMDVDELRAYIEHDEEDDYDPDEDDISFGRYMAKLTFNTVKAVIKKNLEDQ